MKRILALLGKWVVAPLAVLVFVIILAATLRPIPGERETPSGQVRNQAIYVPAADGTRIAIDIWLPADLAVGATIPAIIEGSRYWRDVQVTLIGRLLSLLGESAPGAEPGRAARYFNEHGYAFVAVDVRGTGASFGVHAMEYSPEEMSDYAPIIDWLVTQPWSNGNVGAYGISYSGTTAELMTTTGHPALKAVAPLYSDFDAQFQLATPGGIYQPGFVDAWSSMVLAMDANDTCGVMSVGEEAPLAGFDCWVGKQFVGGVKPVDGDRGWLLEAALAEHASPDVSRAAREMAFRDSVFADTGLTMAQSQAYARQEEIEASGVPMLVVAGWLDAATADGALARFRTFSNRQTAYIGPFSHGGGHDVDPYAAPDKASTWSPEDQLGLVESFFAHYLKGEGDRPDRGLSYYVMNDGSWRTTDRWPPEGRQRLSFYFADGHRLTTTIPELDVSAQLDVDFTATTGSRTRWHTQLGGGDVIYSDRRDQDGKVLRFATDPLGSDLVIVGSVVADLLISSSFENPNLHLYLESVAPDGRVTYLAEGVLRLIHRATNEMSTPYFTDGPPRSFLSSDAVPVVPETTMNVSIGLYATAVRVPAGHRLQLAIAGADAGVFETSGEQSDSPRFAVYSGPVNPSSLTVPVMSN